jgi:hypothetical protein
MLTRDEQCFVSKWCRSILQRVDGNGASRNVVSPTTATTRHQHKPLIPNLFRPHTLVIVLRNLEQQLL